MNADLMPLFGSNGISLLAASKAIEWDKMVKRKRRGPKGMEEYGLNDEDMGANEFDIIFYMFTVKLKDSRNIEGAFDVAILSFNNVGLKKKEALA